MATYSASSLVAVFLDTGVLGDATRQPGRNASADACRAWVEALDALGVAIIVPEVCDYELRREFLRQDNSGAIARLEAFATPFGLSTELVADYLTLNPWAMREAARLWSYVRKAGVPTASNIALDGDCIVGGQVIQWCFFERIALSQVVVATTNVSDLSRFSDAAGSPLQCATWQDITL